MSLYYDYGWTPDPVGEFLRSLATVEELDARLCLAGHGRPFVDVPGHIEATASSSRERLAAVVEALGSGPRTAVELVPEVYGEPLTPDERRLAVVADLCYLRHLERDGGVIREPDGEVERWRAA